MSVVAVDNNPGLVGSVEIANTAVAVTPSDTDQLAAVCNGLLVGTHGTIAVVTAAGDSITIPDAVTTASPLIRIRIKQVKSTGTTASNILALY